MRDISKINKGLIILFGALLLVTIGEIIYYFFFLSPNNQFNTARNDASQSSQASPAIASNPTTQQNLDSYLNSYRLILNSDVITSSVITNIYEGRIQELDTDGGTWASDVPYSIKLAIVNDSKDPFTIYYNENNLRAMQIVQLSNSQEREISFENLAVGNSIKIEEVFILNKDFSKTTMQFKIIKLDDE